MSNKIVLTKYLLAVLISSFIAVFFSLVDKTYSSILQTEQNTLSESGSKITDPKIDTSFLDILESQYSFTQKDLNLDSQTLSQIASTSAQ